MIDIICNDCDKPMQIEYWTLGNDAQLKITPCTCTVSANKYNELSEKYDSATDRMVALQDKHNVLIRKMKRWIDDTKGTTGAKTVDV